MFGESESKVLKLIYSLDQILASILELTRVLKETAMLEKICFGACMPSPGSGNVKLFSVLGSVPWVIEAKEVVTTSATDCSVVEACGGWLGLC